MRSDERVNECIAAAKRYILELGWVLLPVRGPGCKGPKAAIYDGWPECRPEWTDLAELLARRPKAGIALNLGASGLVDVEGDTPEAEALLDDLCAGADFPCWRSARSKHRLFANDGSIGHLKTGGVEIRAGRHYSILPPSPHPDGLTYQWIMTPFGLDPPPPPERLLRFYRDEAAKAPARRSGGSPGRAKGKPFPYRDDLDHVLRHFDLMGEAAAAGVEFVFGRPDANGNVPCHIPDVLRGGNPDENPSGVFNVRNGRLRDFASGTNHLFFHLMGALTGRPWIDVYKEFLKRAGTKGRPHSRRISLPQPHEEPPERVSLDEARQRLKTYLHENLARDLLPKTLHVIEGPPGLGKTWTMCAELASLGKPAILLTLENRLAHVHRNLINQREGRAERMPVLRELGCIHPDEYEQMSRLGYQPSRSVPCQTCSIGPRQCRYLLAFSGLENNLQLCCPAVYHTHGDFYDSHGNERRPVVVFDENCIDLILAPVEHDLSEWRAWGELMEARMEKSRPKMRRHIRKLAALVRWLRVTARDFRKEEGRTKAVAVPDVYKHFKLRKSPALQRWLNGRAGGGSRRAVPNLYDPALYLLTEGGSYVLFEKYRREGRTRVRVRFRRWHRLPEDREVFILDATANEEIIRAAAPGWDVRVWRCPQVEQKGEVIQIMDFDTSRKFISREVARHRPHSPSWLAQVIDAILAEAESAALISFKVVATDRKPEFDILRHVAHRDKIKALHHFPCRGIEVKSDLLVVVGTPYKNETAILEFALALHGADGLPRGEYAWQPRQEDCFVTGNMGYGDERYRAVEEFVVSADLAQAVGRTRPLQNEVKVYVISNAPLPGWEVTKFMASELFDLRKPLRRDAADKYQQYADEVIRRLDANGWVGNPEVCAAVGVLPRTGRNYMARFKEQHRDRLEVDGNRIAWKPRRDAEGGSTTSIASVW